MEPQEQAQERQAYEVPGSQMRWRAAQLRAQGMPFDVERVSHSNTYIFFVQQPTGAQPFAYQPPPQQRQAWPAWDGARIVQIVLATVAAILLLWMGSAMWGRGDDEAAPVVEAQPEAEDGGAWAWLSGLLPWQSEPEAKPVAAAPAKDTGWKWPWESAADAAADAAESVQATVTMVSFGVLAVLVLLIVLALVSKRRGK